MLSVSISNVVKGYVHDEESGNPIKNVIFLSYPENEVITKSNILWLNECSIDIFCEN